ncbi:hypothetical protein HZB60_12235 [candidate division KSB1 bacterium]|nr:hypothetical protein [candidate division KSB1 bacterium]
MTILSLLAACGTAVSFHNGGVAACVACHTMHNSEDGIPVNPTAANDFLLAADSPTDLCLSCHASAIGAAWAFTPLTPAPEYGAGNFVFSSEDNLNDSPTGLQLPLSGSHGVHNCVSPANGLAADPVHVNAPGGSFPSSELGCTSCHDPHGNTNYRLLRGIGQLPVANFYFGYPAPSAEGLNVMGASESPTNHTAYRGGWTNWCANCHGRYHDGGPGFEHPIDRTLGGDVRQSYELYAGSGNPTGGNPATSYLPQLPFEDPSATPQQTSGPTSSSRIACITCHRAHGSSAPDLGRWDFNVQYLDRDGSVSGSYRLPVPYADANQRQLCVKCHQQDAQDHGLDRACIECHRSGEGLRQPAGLPLKGKPN